MVQWRTPGGLRGWKHTVFQTLEEKQILQKEKQRKEHCPFSYIHGEWQCSFSALQAVNKLHDSDVILESASVQSRLHIGHAVCHGIQILFHESVFLL